ncbi:murein biosynthesis integral membrane protein MurJ [bacterium]|nr:murein biosynthesis integral membrane protein MurJ [bacterium]
MTRSSASKQTRIFKGFAKLASGTMASRITGMLREMILAFYLGSGAIMDAYVVAFTLPNLFRRILGEKVLESAVLPTYKQLKNSGDSDIADNLIKTSLFLIVAFGSFITGLGMVFAPLLVHLFAPGFDPETHRLAIAMSRIMFPFLIMISVASMFGVILQSREKFGLFGIAPAAFNISIIAFLWFGMSHFGPLIAAWGVLAGGFLECAVMYPVIRQTFNFKRSKVNIKDKSVRQVNNLALPVFAETILDKTIVLVDRRLASIVSPGSIAALGYSFRLLQLPYAILVLTIARTFYQHFVDAAGDVREFNRIVVSALRFVLALIIPCAAVLIIFGEFIVRLVYQRGAFGEEAVNLTTSAFACYGIGIIGMTALAILTRAFNALKDTKTPFYVSVAMMLLNIIFNYLLVRTPLQHAGLALASSIAYSFAGVTLFILMRRKLIRMEPGYVPVFNLMSCSIKISLATGLAGACGWWVTTLADTTPDFTNSLVFLIIGLTLFSIIYLATLHLLKLPVKSLVKID